MTFDLQRPRGFDQKKPTMLFNVYYYCLFKSQYVGKVAARWRSALAQLSSASRFEYTNVGRKIKDPMAEK